MCNFINKNGEKCKIKKSGENGFCCRHKNSKQQINNEIKTEKVVKKVAKTPINDEIYDKMYENEEPEIAEDSEIEVIDNENEVEPEKRKASQSEISLIKYAYLTIIGWSEIMFPDQLKDAQKVIEKDKLIDEVLVEVADDYSEVLGIADIDPGLKLVIMTTMALGNVAAINSKKGIKNRSTLPSENHDNRIDEIEKQFEDI